MGAADHPDSPHPRETLEPDQGGSPPIPTGSELEPPGIPDPSRKARVLEAATSGIRGKFTEKNAQPGATEEGERS